MTTADLQGVEGVYLLHFAEPISHARHYMGWAKDIGRRLEQHAAGRGARLTAVAKAKGISFELVRVWRHACRDTERKLKRRKEGPALCPVCKP